jgi:hypothetical protein
MEPRPAIVRLMQGKPGAVTSLFTVNSMEWHPMLGKGLMMHMMLPVSYDREQALVLAMNLNLRRLQSGSGAICMELGL